MTQVAYRHQESDLDDVEPHRHWCPQSEKITTGDALMSAIDDGWRIYGVVFQQEHWHSGGRRVHVYHLRLERGDQCETMVVLQNPYITRLLNAAHVQIVQINQRKHTANERW